MTLSSGVYNLLRLAVKGAAAEGWAPVSKVVWPMLQNVPIELLEREWPDGAPKGRCRITSDGKTVLRYS